MIGKHVAFGAALLAALHTGRSQRFSADAASGVGPGSPLTDPFAENLAAADMSDPASPDQVLDRQGFNAVRIFTRTCDCVPRSDDDLVRIDAGISPSPAHSCASQRCACCPVFACRNSEGGLIAIG